MKRKVIISLVLALVITLIPMSTVFAYDSKLVLENKDPEDWGVKEDKTSGVLKYDSSGIDFSYSLHAQGLEENTSYDLIYYADKPDRFVNWGGDNPGALITDGTANGGGNLNAHGETDLGMSLPHPDDANYPDGAKIWLVPSDCYDANTNSVTSWQPSRFLFETELITYERTFPTPSEPYNRYKGLSGVFWVEVFNYGGFDTYRWDDWNSVDRVLDESVFATGEITGANAVLCALSIPEGTHLSYPSRSGILVTNLMLEFDGGEVYFDPENVDFSQPCTLTLIYPPEYDSEEITFTQIRDGLPVPMSVVVPSHSAYKGNPVVLGT